jgi:hypothetical protein
MYLDFYFDAKNKDASVFSLLSLGREDGPLYWNLRLISDFHDWELE